MAIYQGDEKIVDRYVGETLVTRAYQGDKLIFDAYSELSGTLPLSVRSRASQVLKNYRIYGASGSTNILPPQTDTSVWDTVGYIKDDGGIREDQNYRTTTFLDAAEGTLSFTNTSPDSSWYRFGWYDENQLWLSETSGYSDTVTVTPPASAVYMRISINTASDVSFVTAGSAGGVGEKTENLLPQDETFWHDGYYINSQGQPQSNYGGPWGETYSDYVSVIPGQTLTFSRFNDFLSPAWRGIAFYDVNDAFISRTALEQSYPLTVVVPNDAAYCRVTFRTQKQPKLVMLTEGSTAPDTYIPYGYQLPMVAHSSELKDVGDQVLVDGEPWDIVDYNNERTIATLCKKTLSINVPFSTKEALFAFPNGLAAGTYHFKMPKTQWYLLAQDSEKNIEFTLTNDVPPDGQLVVTATSGTLIGGTISCYASSTSTVATETATLSEGNGGTELESPSYTDDPTGNANSILRGTNGPTAYKDSQLRQLLNSSASAGNVWTPTNKFDRPPTWASSIDGFMHGMDVNFINAMASINFVTASKQNASYQLNDKIFLPSYTEISGMANYGVYEGNQYQFYVDADANKRKKYTSNNVSRDWFLRSIGPYAMIHVRYLTYNGNYDYQVPAVLHYISPACHIDLTQSDNPWIKSNMYKSTTTTSIYIGSDPLAENEYVDFGEQKVYRIEGGTPIEEDPPVPFPDITLPQGTVTIDIEGNLKPQATVKGRINPTV